MKLTLLLLLCAALPAAGTPKRHVVIMEQFRFKPGIVRAAVGDTIVWQNHDMVPHTADAAGKAWSSGNIPARSQRITVVKEKGEHTFTCLYHSNMKGKLVVE